MESNFKRDLRRPGRGKKLLEVWQYLSDQNRIEYCKTCTNDSQIESDCDTCQWGSPPPLLPENEEVLELWQAVNTQWRAGGLAVVGLDYSEVRHWASPEQLDIDLSPCVWSKIKVLEKARLEKINAKDVGGGSRGAV